MVNYEKSIDKKFLDDYWSRYQKLFFESRNDESILNFKNSIKITNQNKGRLIFIGNGASASLSSHAATDFTKQAKIPSIAFNDHNLITALSNDYGYEYIFEKQLELYLKPKDMVVAISASGNSPNLLRAINYANQNGAITFGLTAFDGGEMKRICQHGIHVPCAKGEYGPAEDAHMILDHLVATYLKAYCVKEVSICSPDLAEELA